MRIKYQRVVIMAGLCSAALAYAGTEETISAGISQQERIFSSKTFKPHRDKLENQRSGFPDGAIGFELSDMPRRPDAPNSDPKVVAAYRLRSIYCSSSAIVTARLLNSKSFLNDEESLVLTAWRFKIADTLKSDSISSNGKNISVISIGGEVSKNSKLMRIKNNITGEFEKDKLYLLFLQHPRDDYSPVYTNKQPLLEVSGNQVTSVSTTAWLAYPATFRIDDMMKDIRDSVGKNPCE